jgi:hypothetical protein
VRWTSFAAGGVFTMPAPWKANVREPYPWGGYVMRGTYKVSIWGTIYGSNLPKDEFVAYSAYDAGGQEQDSQLLDVHVPVPKWMRRRRARCGPLATGRLE